MKYWLTFIVLSLALMSTACINKEQTAFEDAGKKVDQGIQTTGGKIDEGLNKAGKNIQKGFDQAGDDIKDATH